MSKRYASDSPDINLIDKNILKYKKMTVEDPIWSSMSHSGQFVFGGIVYESMLFKNISKPKASHLHLKETLNCKKNII